MIVWPLQSQARQYYGNPSVNLSRWEKEFLVDVPCPWTLYMDKEELHSIRINKNCAASLSRVLNNVWEAVDKDQGAIETLHYHLYSGSFNYRPMRGGSALSMHSYGCAIDWDDAENEQHSQKHLFKDTSLLIVKFKEEGWEWGGDWHGASIDPMHVQAARVHGQRAVLSAIHDPWPPIPEATANTVVYKYSNNVVVSANSQNFIIPATSSVSISNNISSWWKDFWS
jgi:hypothetical protein